MVNVKEFAKSWSSKKELCDLPALDIATLSIENGEFEVEGGSKKKWYYIEIDGYKYSLKSNILSQIKTILETRPLATKIQFKKAPNGEIVVFDL